MKTKLYAVPVTGFVMIEALNDADMSMIFNEAFSNMPHVEIRRLGDTLGVEEVEAIGHLALIGALDDRPLGETIGSCKELLIDQNGE